MKAFLALEKKVPSLKDRFAKVVNGGRREGQLLIRIEGIPSGPGEVEDLILAIARFRDKVSKIGRGGMLMLGWCWIGGSQGGTMRGDSKEELKWLAKSSEVSSGDDAVVGPREQRGGTEVSERRRLVTLQNCLESFLTVASISAMYFLRRNLPRKLHSLRSWVK